MCVSLLSRVIPEVNHQAYVPFGTSAYPGNPLFFAPLPEIFCLSSCYIETFESRSPLASLSPRSDRNSILSIALCPDCQVWPGLDEWESFERETTSLLLSRKSSLICSVSDVILRMKEYQSELDSFASK